jgi:hypothetical protein
MNTSVIYNMVSELKLGLDFLSSPSSFLVLHLCHTIFLLLLFVGVDRFFFSLPHRRSSARLDLSHRQVESSPLPRSGRRLWWLSSLSTNPLVASISIGFASTVTSLWPPPLLRLNRKASPLLRLDRLLPLLLDWIRRRRPCSIKPEGLLSSIWF